MTLVPAPLRPPTAKPEPKPAVCLTLTVMPKMLKANGKPDKVTTKVTAAAKRVKGAKVAIAGAGIKKTGLTNGKGVAVLRVNPKKPGIVTITVVEANQKLCGPKRRGRGGVPPAAHGLAVRGRYARAEGQLRLPLGLCCRLAEPALLSDRDDEIPFPESMARPGGGDRLLGCVRCRVRAGSRSAGDEGVCGRRRGLGDDRVA